MKRKQPRSLNRKRGRNVPNENSDPHRTYRLSLSIIFASLICVSVLIFFVHSDVSIDTTTKLSKSILKSDESQGLAVNQESQEDSSIKNVENDNAKIIGRSLPKSNSNQPVVAAATSPPAIKSQHDVVPASNSAMLSTSKIDTLSAVDKTKAMLRSHPLKQLKKSYLESAPLEEVMKYLQDQPQCGGKPIFTSMANVGSDLYWQMFVMDMH